MGIEEAFNFRRVSDTVTTSGVVSPGALAGLAAEGYDLVVNLLPDTSEHAVPGEGEFVRAQGLDYVAIPVDFDAPAHEDYERFAAVMDTNEGRSIHVHCAANYRVSAFYALYAIARGRWTVADADEHIRGLWNPDDHPAWRAFLAAERG